MRNKIITIGREYGSGGHQIAEAIAKHLQCKYYDKELLWIASKESGIGKEFFEKADETKSGTFLHAMSMGFNIHTMVNPTTDYLSNEALFNIQAKVMHEIASKESCVIVGRCADYILRNENPVRIFITCDPEERIKRVAKNLNISKKEAEEYIHKMDKTRASYYNYYTDQQWGEAKNYDITLNSAFLDIDTTIELLLQIINKYYSAE